MKSTLNIGGKTYRKHGTFKIQKKAYTKKSGISKQELEVLTMITKEFPGLQIYRSNREILHGRELDIYIPSKNLAIEFDGLFYHNTSYTGTYFNQHSPKNAAYHLSKTIGCEKKGIQLIHVFSDEWEKKKPLVIDLIKKTLGKSQIIKAEDCAIQPITPNEGKFFLDCSSLLCDEPSAQSYQGLYYNNELVAVISYTETDDEVLIYRYTERITITIDKGLSLFTSQFTNKKLITEVDRRLTIGKEFLEDGFVKVKATDPKLFYTKDYKSRMPSWRSGLTEEQAFQKNLVGVYDCGDIIMEKSTETF